MLVFSGVVPKYFGAIRGRKQTKVAKNWLGESLGSTNKKILPSSTRNFGEKAVR